MSRLCCLLLAVCGSLRAVTAEEGLRVAISLAGQLSRLELASKLTQVFRHNVARGVHVSVFVYLDAEGGNQVRAQAQGAVPPHTRLLR